MVCTALSVVPSGLFLGSVQLKLGATGPLCCLLLACTPSTSSLRLFLSLVVSHTPALHWCAAVEVAEQEAFLSLAQPMQELYLAYVSVGPSDLSEKDRIPSILDQLELVAKAAWARPLDPAHCWGQTCPSVAREVLQGLLR